MSTCPVCKSELNGSVCPTCSAGDATRTSVSASGTLTPLPEPRAPRFQPGALLAARYRIVTLLGRGGMGEVYRADDLSLGQSVALKFLPVGLEDHPEAIARFRNEVRIARGVSHPNVCRVYDLAEVDRHLFLSMEYVDGEDLGSLLRRIGRLPTDKAVEIARKLCAGLAAAHEQGVLHRDLKPANVMLDGRGQVRLTDFGIAGLAGRIGGAEIRSGTPAYMSPEQLEGREVTVRSDLYSLGLVLYEIFTGKQPFASDTIPGLLQQKRQGTMPTPATLVRDLDPAVERVILRCLDPDPARRPASALAVAAALPGGDPLAAALAAGETPSPEMVAAAGEGAGIGWRLSAALVGTLLVLVVAHAVLAYRSSAIEKLRPEYSGEVLAVKSRELLTRLGYTQRPADAEWGFYWEEEFFAYLKKKAKKSPVHWDQVLFSRPALLSFCYRQAQSPMTGVYVHTDLLTPGLVTPADPPPTESGMTGVWLDYQGRLLRFSHMPDEKLSPAAPGAPTQPDWKPLFDAAGLDPSRLTTTEPLWLGLEASDTRRAWTGQWPGSSLALRVEAAAFRGKPVAFALLGDWTVASRMPSPESAGTLAKLLVLGALVVAICIGVTVLARRNLAEGRGDRRGALRLASAIFWVCMSLWLCQSHLTHGLGLLGMFFLAAGHALFLALVVWVIYLGVEPALRRRWPQLIISWTTLLAGGWRDPVVGRDVLLGAATGAGWALLTRLTRLWTGAAIPSLDALETFSGARASLGLVLQMVPYAVRNGLIFLFLLFVLRVALRNQWLAGIAWTCIFVGLTVLEGGDHMALRLAINVVIFANIAVLTLRCGLLPLVVAFVTSSVLMNLRITADWQTWHFSGTLAGLAAIAAIAYWGWLACQGQPKRLSEH
jgi:serine/threonine-protein kinase